MANISSTFGSVVITAQTSAKAKAICKALDSILNGNFDYYTDFSIDTGVEKDNFFRCSFVGTGRWAYIYSLEDLGRKLDYFKRFDEHAEAIKVIEENDFTLDVEFTDEEGGNAFIMQCDGVIEHKANTPVSELVFVESNRTDYEYTRENLKLLCGYDDCDLDDMFADYEDEACR